VGSGDENDAWVKSNDTYSLSIRVQTTLNLISILPRYPTSKKLFFFAERIDNGKLANQIAGLAAIVVKAYFSLGTDHQKIYGGWGERWWGIG